jgi:three-Cys-motif partner protein
VTPSHPHQFGGQWTEDKLTRLRKYLKAYVTIFKGNPKASWFQTIYVDAFAGTGSRDIPSTDGQSLLPVLDEEDVKDFRKGSAKIALETEPSFDQFFFIEQNPRYATQLEQLREQFPSKNNLITILRDNANLSLIKWCGDTNWRTHRAVVFLDPYGMQVEWKTIEAIAQTQAIDLWLLFPLGQSVNRLLTKKSPPEGAWADRLTRFFGTPTWKDVFYQPSPQLDMFGTNERVEKTATFDAIKDFFVQRLTSVFAKVAENPLLLYNSKNVPIYLFCFASANPKGAKTAVKIAQDILRKH